MDEDIEDIEDFDGNVQCEDCGWIGWDIQLPRNPAGKSHCPECGSFEVFDYPDE